VAVEPVVEAVEVQDVLDVKRRVVHARAARADLREGGHCQLGSLLQQLLQLARDESHFLT